MKDKGYFSISMEEAIRRMEDDSDFVVLDVRLPFEYAAGHFPCAIHHTKDYLRF